MDKKISLAGTGKNCTPSRRRAVARFTRAIEPLENRRMLSVANPTPPRSEVPPLIPTGKPQVDSTITPIDYRIAYGMPNIMFGSTAGTGLGMTICIIDAGDENKLFNTGTSQYSTSDLAEFDSLYGFPDPPQFVKVNETGGSTLPANNANDGEETALDVEYAHAMAPSASILLVECSSLNDNDLTQGVIWARSIPGVVDMSMSFGGGEFPGETSMSSATGSGAALDDGDFQTPSGHNGIVFIASSGDTGFVVESPSVSPYVVAAGGTVLTSTNGVWGSESGWIDSGGGVSQYESNVSYQSGIGTQYSTTHRMVPDVSMNAGKPTAIYDTDGVGGTTTVEGTSIVSPALAGVVAVIDQGRSLEGLPPLYSYVSASSTLPQMLPRLYQLPSSDFHDITTGSSSSNSLAKAGTGYDLVTGIGTPINGNFVPDLAGGVTVSGTVYSDNNSNGTLDGGETGVSGVRVYIDLNGNGSYDSATEPSAVTAANGTYSFQYDIAGAKSITIREVPPAGYIQTGTTAPSFTTSYNSQASENFGNFPTSYSAAQQYYVRLDGTGTTVQVYQGTSASGSPVYSIAKATLGSTPLSFKTAVGSTDELVVDYSNGDPMAASGQFSFVPAGGSTSTLVIEGTPASSTISVTSAGVVVNSQSIPTTGVQNVVINAAGGSSALSLNFTSNPYTNVTLNGQANGDTITLTGTNSGGTTGAYSFGGNNESLNVSVANAYTITGNASMGATGGVALTDSSPLKLVGSQTLSSLAINGSNGSVTIARSSPSVVSVVVATGLSVDTAHGAYLDLDNNAMVINYASSSPIGYVTGLLQSGVDGGAWDGVGIRSKAAANDPFGLTAIGAIDNGQLDNLTGNPYTSFDGVPVTDNAVLLKYTYYGDSDLSGSVDTSDINNLDAGYGTSGGGWLSGDFDYSGTVDSGDLNLLDANYGATPPL